MTKSRTFESIGQAVRFSLRTLRKSPTFSIAVILTLALGIGANTAMFSVIRAVLLKPLEYREPDRLVLVTDGATPARAEKITTASRSYSEVGSYAGLENLALSGFGEPEVLNGVRVSANFLQILGVAPLQGRAFLPEEDQPGAATVVIISAELWRRRFARESTVIGKTIVLAGVPATIIGVLPPGFQFPIAGADVWLTKPSEWSVLQPKARPLSPFLSVFGRLKGGVSVEQATAELAVVDGQYATDHPGMLDTKPDSPDVVLPLKEELVSDVRPKLWMLFGAVTFVLLIVCANIGGLLLARAASRAREFAVRVAIGAGRGRIIGQLLAENVLLAFSAGALGIALAATSLRGIRSMTFVDLPRAGEIRLDGMVLAFGATLALLTGLMFGLVPALAASRPDLAGVLRGSGEGSVAARSKSRVPFGSRGLLVIGQMALSIILLIGATLLIESLARVYRVKPGFEPANVLTMRIAPSPAHYDTPEKKAAFYDQLVQRADSLPGVRGAAVATTLPMADQWMGTTLAVTGRAEVELNQRPIAIFENITPGYFRTLAIALKRGRDFTSQDKVGSTPVGIINESTTRIFWPDYPRGPDPIGQHVLFGSDAQLVEIVGISADVHQTGRDMDPKPTIYIPCLQKPPEAEMLAMRTNGDPLSFAGAVRSQILAIDRDQPVSDISTLEDIVEASEGELRLMMRLLAAFAAVATLLAVVGLYGVISYSVVQRTKEIGIRRALGAQTGSVLSLIARQAISLALMGIALGVGASLVLSRLMKDLLFQVSATDPATFAGISILFVIVALAASYIPARRAASVDPMAVLRIG